jgi:hypothetical protein
MKERVLMMKIPILVKRVKVDLGGVLKKYKITHLRPPIPQMLVMSFLGKGIMKRLPLNDAQVLKAGCKMI